MSHTPGPWIVEEDFIGGRSRARRSKTMLMVVAEKGGMPGLIVNQPPVVTATDEANARLIAAAPDLLEALKEIERTAESMEHWAVYDIARAAIAKAEGK